MVQNKIFLGICLTFLLFVSGISFAGMAKLNVKPDLDTPENMGYRLVGENLEDKFHEIPGSETLVRIFKKDHDIIALYVLPNLNVYAYAVKRGKFSLTAFIDEDNDGYCERTVEAEEDFFIDMKAYGY